MTRPEIIPCHVCGQPSCGCIDLLITTPHGYDEERLSINLCASCQIRLANLVAVWVDRQAEIRGNRRDRHE